MLEIEDVGNHRPSEQKKTGARGAGQAAETRDALQGKSSRRQGCQRLCMQFGRRCRDNGATAFRWPAAPIRHHTAGLFDDRNEGNNVIGLQTSLNDKVDLASG